MKIAITVAVSLIIGISLVAAEKQILHKDSQSAIHQRQPLISPERQGESIDFKRFKRQNRTPNLPTSNAVVKFQEFLNNCKAQCAEKMGLAPNEVDKSFLFEENPTPKEKCLMACVLERTKIMDNHNKVSIDTIGRIAGMISNKNELIMAIARATAENCNRHINPSNKCEAAAQINRCVANGLRVHKIKLVY